MPLAVLSRIPTIETSPQPYPGAAMPLGMQKMRNVLGFFPSPFAIRISKVQSFTINQ